MSKPILGGLKKAQAFLAEAGYPLPVFSMNIYGDSRESSDPRHMPGKGVTISIDEAIAKYGVACEVTDVRLADEQQDSFILFSEPYHVSIFEGRRAYENCEEVLIELYTNNRQFKDFMDSSGGESFFSLVWWGKQKPSLLDKIKMFLSPERYFAKVFA